MNIYLLLPFVVGICTVLQGALNQRMSTTGLGLAWVLTINSILVLLFAALMLSFGFFPGKFSITALKWWHVVPGIFGFLVILLIPLSIVKLGALNSFLILISSQILVSALWDRYVENVDLSLPRIIGAGLVLVGAWLATK